MRGLVLKQSAGFLLRIQNNFKAFHHWSSSKRFLVAEGTLGRGMSLGISIAT